jgi:hypothetical protein
VHAADQVYSIYTDPSRDFWAREVMPQLKLHSLSALINATGLSRRALIEARNGEVRPHPRNQYGAMAITASMKSIQNAKNLRTSPGTGTLLGLELQRDSMLELANSSELSTTSPKRPAHRRGANTELE